MQQLGLIRFFCASTQSLSYHISFLEGVNQIMRAGNLVSVMTHKIYVVMEMNQRLILVMG